MQPLKGTAVISGGAKGIGLAAAEVMACENMNIALIDLDERSLAAASARVLAKGAKVLALEADISDEKRVNAAAHKIAEAFGWPDILVHSAGIALGTPFEEIPGSEWDRVLGVNLKGAFLLAQAFIPHMREKGYGRIVNISSMAGVAGSENAGGHYCASKAGIIGLTKHLAKAYARFGITVNAIAPGPVDTDMVRSLGEDVLRGMKEVMPMKKIGAPEDIGNIAAFLASGEAGFITGAVIEASGGQIII
jgi:3-oxoacyl-[acyl-carrier protein] reductase